MACPTCDNTMPGLGHGIFHCSRCGTVKMPNDEVYVPAIVTRGRSFEISLIHCRAATVVDLQVEWRRNGMAESVNLPERRPK